MVKFLADFFPVLLFFAAYKLFDIYVATAVAIAASAVQVGYHWFAHHKVPNTYWLTFGILAVFGGLTIWLQDPTFIKWKPTIINWLFAVVFLGSGMFSKRNLTRRMMEHAIDLPEPVWDRLNVGWVLFFLTMGALNLYVAYNFAEATWVNFKLFGMMGLTILFVLLQSLYLSRHIRHPEEEKE